MRRWGIFFQLGILLAVASCSRVNQLIEAQERKLYDSPKTFFSTMRDLVVEVAYEPQAEPYVGEGFRPGTKTWDFVEANLAAVFRGRHTPVSLTIPKDLRAMREIPPQHQARYTNRAIVELAEQYREGRSSKTQANFFVIFLNGQYEEGGVANPKVIGVSLSGTTIIAIFKPSVTSALNGSPDGEKLPKYLEQSTLVHEMGHALGLVNNGVPLTRPHHDVEHGAHCTNNECVMYYRNEGVDELKKFVQRFISTGNLVVFGDECLQDLKSYRPEP